MNNPIRELPSRIYFERPLPLEFQQFAEREIVPLLPPPRYKRNHWRITILHCLHNVITAGLMGYSIADGRDPHKTPNLRIECWNALLENGLVRMAKGSQLSRRVTRYIPTARLLEKQKLWKRDLLDNGDVGDLVVLTTGKTHWLTGNHIPLHKRGAVSIRERLELISQRDAKDYRTADPRAVANGLAYFREIESIIDRINRRAITKSCGS